MSIKEISGVQFVTFDLYKNLDFLKCIFTTRIGGVSEGVCESLNLAFSKEENKANVYENYRRICKAAGLSYEGVTLSNQVHKTNVKVLEEKDKAKGFSVPSDIKEIDGLITNVPGIVLTTFYADCVPLYFVDPHNKAIASSHAGWRGTVHNICTITIDKMRTAYGTNPKDLLCVIGPSIHQCCFEVDAPVAEEFYNKVSFAHMHIKNNNNKNKYYIDLQGINKRHLLNAGVREENIEVSPLCTKCNGDLFFSHRVMGENRGTMAAMMELTEHLQN